jgi:Domain of unknown function (DUF3846)
MKRLCSTRGAIGLHEISWKILKDLLYKAIHVCDTCRTGSARQLPARATKGPTMSQTLSSQRVASRPIRALIIRPDSTYEVREIEQDIRTLESIVGGYVEAYSTGHCTFWYDSEGEFKDQPTNKVATYLWWKLCPEVEGRDVLQGTVFVTGVAAEDGDSLPLSDDVVELFEQIEQIYREEEGK